MKRAMSILMATVMVGSLSSVCAMAAEEGTNDKAQIEFWDMTWGSTDYINAAEALVAEFNASQDEIEVTYQSIPWDNYYQTYMTAIASGTAPDVSTGAGYQQHQFAVMGEILSLDSIIEEWEEEGTLGDFIDGSIEQFQWEGEQIAVPFNGDPRAIYYRKDVFEEKGIEVPTTWDEFIEAAKALTTDDMYGFTCAGSDNGGYWAMLNFIFGEGGSIFTEDMEPNFDSAENMKAMSDVRELMESGVLPAGTASYSQEDAQKLYLQGNAAMVFSAANFGDAIAESDDEKLIENTEIMELIPAEDGNCYSVGGMNGIMAYSQTEHPEEAKAFIKWWSENNAPLWSEGKLSSFPLRSSFLEMDYFTSDKLMSEMSELVMPNYVTSNQPISYAFPAMAGLEGELVFSDTMQMCLDSSYNIENIAETTTDSILSILEDYAE